MSLFLGPIHYWLYGKIGNQEKLTSAIADRAKERGWIRDESIYVKELPPLETVIDESNIHGWLQAQITDAEQRYAGLITEIETEIDEIKQLASEFGRQHGIDAEADPAEIYKYFEDFFVNGMPCDRINAVTDQDESSLSWEMSRDIHAPYWKEEDTTTYYGIRKSVMDGMLEGTPYSLSMMDDYHYRIEKTV